MTDNPKDDPVAARLLTLQPDLLSLSEEELLAKIRDIRDDRKITKAPPKTVRKKATNEIEARKALQGMDSKTLQALMEKLGV